MTKKSPSKKNIKKKVTKPKIDPQIKELKLVLKEEKEK